MIFLLIIAAFVIGLATLFGAACLAILSAARYME